MLRLSIAFVLLFRKNYFILIRLILAGYLIHCLSLLFQMSVLSVIFNEFHVREGRFFISSKGLRG